MVSRRVTRRLTSWPVLPLEFNGNVILNLECRLEPAAKYRNNAQVARVVTEDWCARQMFCPACPSDALTAAPNNCPGIDFTCPNCSVPFQLKSRKLPLANRIVDAGYDAMIRAITSDQVPNLFLLQYSRSWSVLNLIVVPSFFLTESVIEKRKPLSSGARRFGWVGCNILLGGIPIDGRIFVVSNGIAFPPSTVREQYARIRPLRVLKPEMRGWTLDVLNVLRKLGQREISLSQVYDFEESLRVIHPSNRNIRAKIRQQMQILRDLGFLAFEDRGRYRVLS